MTFAVPEAPSSAATNKHRSQTILEEDEYTAAIEHIIERDFYPDIQPMKLQLAYIEARKKRDLNAMREIEAQFRAIKSPRVGSQARSAASTPSPWTPSSTPSRTPTAATVGRSVAPSEALASSSTTPNIDKLTLDKFLHQYTSEDNASFSVLMEKEEENHRAKYWWVYEKVGTSTQGSDEGAMGFIMLIVDARTRDLA